MRQSAYVLSKRATSTRSSRSCSRRGSKPAGGGGGGGGEETDGKTLFTQAAEPACASCHTLEDAGATGTTGPNLDKVDPGKLDEAFIKQSIEDPDAKIADGLLGGDHAALR